MPKKTRIPAILRPAAGKVEDFTEVRHQDALLTAGALQTAIFNSANFSRIATDAKGVIQIFNVGAERMLGYKAAEVMNKITPADISDAGEVIARDRDGKQTVVSLNATTFYDRNRKLQGVFAAARDITERKRLDAECDPRVRPADGVRFPAAGACPDGKHKADSSGGLASAEADQRDPRSRQGRVRAGADVEGAGVAG
jgi:hypothetical protein